MKNETHEEALKRLDLKIGDTVKVVREWNSHSQGWANSWNSTMNIFIGKIYKVIELFPNVGIKLYDETIQDFFWFPAFSLEKVTASPEVQTPEPYESVKEKCELLKKELALMEEKMASLVPKPKTIEDLMKSVLAFLVRHSKDPYESIFFIDICKSKLYIDKCLSLSCLIAVKNDKMFTFDFESDYVVVTVLAKKPNGTPDYDAVCKYLDETDVEFAIKGNEKKALDAVEFAKWIMKETNYRTDGDYWFEYDDDENPYSTEDLYKKFLEWKQTDKS